MCPYLYSGCLVWWVLKNTYFKEYLSVVASKYRICDTKAIHSDLNCTQCLSIAPMEKALWRQLIIPLGF